MTIIRTIFLVTAKKNSNRYADKVYRLILENHHVYKYLIFHKIYVRNPGTFDVEIYLLILVLIFVFQRKKKSLEFYN